MTRVPEGIVRRNGIRFEIDGRPFRFAGCNCYHILYADRPATIRLLDEMAGIGADVVRIWAFGHGKDTPVEEPKGVYDPAFLSQLDFILEIDRLKRVERMTRITGGARRENSAEHSWHLAILALVVSINVFGEGLRDILDPRLKIE